ncbi:MAG: J domain-containing protein [Syntrophobacteraceae bacterium]
MDLGANPSDYIEYPGGSGFFLKPIIEENLQKMGVSFESDELEYIFKPFLRPEIRLVIERFNRVHRRREKVSCNLEDLAQSQRAIHIFDARRLYYLRFGRMDSGELGMKNWKFLNVFLCKSRDEIESMLERMELQLPPGEYATYVYASLGVPLFFSQYMRDYPSALDTEKLDDHVVGELCRLDRDEDFFLGVERDNGGGLHPYLRKYAWLYFDFEFQVETWFEGFHSARGFGQMAPPVRPAVSIEEAYAMFGISSEQFTKMSSKELTRLFRRKAKKSHPDKGGEHEDFLKLSEAYEHLISVKKRTTANP